MTEEPRVEEVNCPSMEAFAASQKSFKQGFVRVNGYIMPRRYLQDRPPESTKIIEEGYTKRKIRAYKYRQ
jgi:hypothetical protein